MFYTFEDRWVILDSVKFDNHNPKTVQPKLHP